MNSAVNSTNINLQLVESLLQAIHSLSPAEQILLRSRLLADPLTTKPENYTVRQSVIDILNQSPTPQLFPTPEEVDCYLQQERSTWDN
ncbi:hypothetical protein PL11201_510101 [Planktothrix sp. PCC 11201]|uniref:hypothetical protein n=1 Tax=Planktothrix sp. PCC 11201 TaxID=1729650 RepID=UPI00091E7871|nr:hypothetical protein [Planktothrix sp. PCC 11201]SKB13473.1 hypothetical protein PL11201_510101 [Planktothrix sp. PCC 11201]